MLRYTSWFHIGTHNHPADIVSRGCWPSRIENFKLRWNGPKWLSDNSSKWPIKGTEAITSNEVITESKTTSCVMTINNHDKGNLRSIFVADIINMRCGILQTCFIRNALSEYADKHYGPVQANEYDLTVICIIKQVQAIHFEFVFSTL